MNSMQSLGSRTTTIAVRLTCVGMPAKCDFGLPHDLFPPQTSVRCKLMQRRPPVAVLIHKLLKAASR
jgi:hypothetical protein